MIAAAAITSGFGVWVALVNSRGARDSANSSSDADKYESLVKAQEAMREEYRDESKSLKAELRAQSAEMHAQAKVYSEELTTIRRRQSELEGQLIRQNKYFEGVMLKLESFMTLKDAELIVKHIQRLVIEMREFMENSPIGLPELAKNRLLEKAWAESNPPPTIEEIP